MIRRTFLPLGLATLACVAILLGVHRPPLESANDLRLLAILIGLTFVLVAAEGLLLVPVAMLLRAAALPLALAALSFVAAGAVIGKGLLWLLIPGLPLTAMVPGVGVALIWLAFNRHLVDRASR